MNMLRLAYLLLSIAITCSCYSVEVIAHRGFTTESKDNTLASISEAWTYEAQIVEVDIQILEDRTIVLFHDLELEGHKLTDLDYAELQRLTQSYHVPTLAEALKEVAPQKSIILDLKSNTFNFASTLCALLNKENIEFNIIIQSPDLPILHEIEKKLSNRVQYHFLTKLERTGIQQKEPSANEIIEELSSSKITGVSVKGRRFIDKKFVEAFRAAGLTFYVWTINDPKRILHYSALGVDGIITDNPKARKKIDANKAREATP